SRGAANDQHGSVTISITKDDTNDTTPPSSPLISPQFSQKLLAELFATYFLVFAGCGAIMVNNEKNNVVGQTGIAIVWGAAVMVMVYTVGHVSGAHMNPAVTIALASFRRFPWKEVPGYVIAQILAATVASGTLHLIFNETHDHFVGNVPPGSEIQSLVMEIIITFYLMFVICSVATDDRATGQLAGVAIGSTVLLSAMFAGPISGASMNPARSIGPALVWNEYKGLWVYILGPTIGAISGAWAYNTIRFKPLSETTKGASSISTIIYGVVSLFNYDLWVYLNEMVHLIAEFLGTYFMVFAGCGVVVVDTKRDHAIGQTGIAIVWGLVVMVMIYTIGHISGAHFNPAVTIAFASSKKFPMKQVPPYIIAQFLGSTLASGSLRLIFNSKNNNLGATIPIGSNLQSLVLEFIITFYLMFVISSVATDDRAIGEAAGLAIGSTILLNAMFAGPISGASMNPARTLGPAIVSNQYRGLWVYIVGPILGAIGGAWAYGVIRFTDKPVREIVKSSSFLKKLDAQICPSF
ncbi:hypothetical protein M8C21_017915, partial [Ambrosia artemisiifolia]